MPGQANRLDMILVKPASDNRETTTQKRLSPDGRLPLDQYMNLRLVFCGILMACSSGFGQLYFSSTVAGTGNSPGWSGDGGPAAQAQFNTPLRVALDKTGSLYLVDFLNYSVRKVDTRGVVSTVAGNGSFGFSGDGGQALGSQLSAIRDIAFDGNGNLFIADSNNSRIRMVDTRGIITTFAGNGSVGYSGDGGPATLAQVNFPVGLAVDSANNVYVADAGNATIRKITRSTGVISTFAGTGLSSLTGWSGEGLAATKAQLGAPYSLAFDPRGNLIFADIAASRLVRIGADGRVVTLRTNFSAQNLFVDASGTIYFPDYVTHSVQKILPDGTLLWVAGNGNSGYAGDGGPGTAAQLARPYGVAVDPAGNVFIAEAGSSVIRRMTPEPFSIGGVASAAGLSAFAPLAGDGGGSAAVPVSPGEIVVVFGTGIGPATLAVNAPSNGVFGTQLAGTSVSFNGISAPMIYASSGVTAAIVPYRLFGASKADVTVTFQGRTTRVTTVPVTAAAPAFFTRNASGSGQAAALNENGTLNLATAPAAIGTIITFYATGEGTTTPAGVDGKVAGTVLLPQVIQPVSVTIGGVNADLAYAGAAPSLVAGVMQINARIPVGITPGLAVPVQLTIGGATSPTVTVAVSAQ